MTYKAADGGIFVGREAALKRLEACEREEASFYSVTTYAYLAKR